MLKTTGIKILAGFEEEINPRFPEALVRGGLGYGMKKMMCINKSAADCGECIISETCLYSLMYSETGKTKKGLQVSPYAVYCRVQDSKRLAIEFILFEPLLEYYGHIVAVLAEIGKTGIGRDRNNFAIKEISDIFAPEKTYSGNSMAEFKPSVKYWQIETEEAAGIKTCAIEFISPARIERRGEFQTAPGFQDIIKSCAMRYLNLERAYSKEKTEFSSRAKEIIESAGDVKTEECAFQWNRKERFSSRQKTKISAGGITGRAVYSGETGKFAGLLEFGSRAGIGKNTAFGCGRFIYKTE